MMTDGLVPVSCIGAFLFLTEMIFFIWCHRWLKSSKALREKDFARIDIEREEILRLQAIAEDTLKEARLLAADSGDRQARIGVKLQMEWNDMCDRIDAVAASVEEKAQTLLDQQQQDLGKLRMAVDKSTLDAQKTVQLLNESVEKARKFHRLLNEGTCPERITQTIQEEKYLEAKRRLQRGEKALEVSRDLKISMGELTILSQNMS